MKYIINSKNKKMLSKADALMVQWKDRIDILDLAHDYSVPIILFVPLGIQDLGKELTKMVVDARGNLVVCVNSLEDAKVAAEVENCKFYFNRFLKSFRELREAIALGTSYIMMDDMLFHSYKEVKQICDKEGVEIILTPTIAKHDVFASDAAYGTYIRPEDVILYEGCWAYFGNTDSDRETTLHRIYSVDKAWVGRLDMLVEDIETEALNRLIVPDFGARRLECGMRCMTTSSCDLCHTVLKLASMRDELRELLKDK